MVPLTGRERERESEKEEGEEFLFWFLDLRDSRALGGETTRLDRFQDYPLTGFSFVEALERVFWHKKSPIVDSAEEGISLRDRY